MSLFKKKKWFLKHKIRYRKHKSINFEVIEAVTKIYTKLSDKTFESLEEMDYFPANYVLPKFTQEEGET